MLPWHRSFGVYIYSLAVATVTTGFLDKVTFLQTSKVISRYSIEVMLVNYLGVLVVILGCVVMFAVITPTSEKVESMRDNRVGVQ